MSSKDSKFVRAAVDAIKNIMNSFFSSLPNFSGTDLFQVQQ